MRLLLTNTSGVHDSPSVPDQGDNIFERIIRNPNPASRHPRERECTEMICGLIRNAPIARSKLFNWLGSQTGQERHAKSCRHFDIDTELPIKGKRDDLRVVGRLELEDETPLLVWSIEVKVGASIHESSSISDGEEEDVVSQIANYDLWLSEQSAQSKSGFILSIDDLSDAMPTHLRAPWACITWTGLAGVLEELLGNGGLPMDEQFLISHCLGFIRNHLWRRELVASNDLVFDDIALLKAFQESGMDMQKKVDRLVSAALPISQKLVPDACKLTHQQTLLKPTGRSALVGKFLGTSVSYPDIYIGINGKGCHVWLESAPTSVEKPMVRHVIEARLTHLKQRCERWNMPQLPWTDLANTLPLEHLLVSEDQEKTFLNFVENALQDLIEVNLEVGLSELLSTNK